VLNPTLDQCRNRLEKASESFSIIARPGLQACVGARIIELNQHPGKIRMARLKSIWVLVAFAFCAPLCGRTESLSPEAVASYLISTVAASGCVFIRNGSEHTGAEAAAHMRKKFDYFKKKIKTPEDFINRCASKSELSGKPYMVRFPDGKTIRCDEWMKKLVEQKKDELK
jgi:hypothetical protein